MPPETNDSSMGIVLGIILAVVVLILFFVYASPTVQSPDTNEGTTIINVPTGSSTGY